MSYDVYFEIDTGGTEPVDIADRNYTRNVSQMWAHAISPDDPTNLGLTIDAHPTAPDLLPIIQRAITRMEALPDYYRAMNPPNGWGDYEGALAYLQWIAANCEAHPKATVRASR